MDESKEHFRKLASAVHDFRSPLSTIILNADLLAEGDAGPLNPMQSKMVETIARNCHHMTRMIDDFLKFSALNSGQTSCDRTRFNYRELIERNIETLRHGNRSPIELTFDPDGSSFEIEADRDQLAEALRLIIENAQRASPEDRSIGVNVRAAESEVETIVTDHGARESYIDLDRAFDPLYDAFSGKESTGLEMAIARLSIELNGGKIGIRKEDDSGVSLYFSLPV